MELSETRNGLCFSRCSLFAGRRFGTRKSHENRLHAEVPPQLDYLRLLYRQVHLPLLEAALVKSPLKPSFKPLLAHLYAATSLLSRAVAFCDEVCGNRLTRRAPRPKVQIQPRTKPREGVAKAQAKVQAKPEPKPRPRPSTRAKASPEQERGKKEEEVSERKEGRQEKVKVQRQRKEGKKRKRKGKRPGQEQREERKKRKRKKKEGLDKYKTTV